MGCELVGWQSRRSEGENSVEKEESAGMKNHVCLKHQDSGFRSLIGQSRFPSRENARRHLSQHRGLSHNSCTIDTVFFDVNAMMIVSGWSFRLQKNTSRHVCISDFMQAMSNLAPFTPKVL